MPPFKPMKIRDYEQWVRQYGWYIKKGGIDWNLYDENGAFQCFVKITHPGPKEVTAGSVKRTERKLKEAERL